jgi:hypothetical protein
MSNLKHKKKVSSRQDDLKIEKILKREERLVFHKISELQKHHQVVFALIIFCSITFMWRGFWNLLDVYWFPKWPFFSSISCMVVGGLLLFLSHQIIRQLVGPGGGGGRRPKV